MINVQLLTPAEVGGILRVDTGTVVRWEKAGRIACIRTPGGHRRYRREEVMALLAAGKLPGGHSEST